MPIAMVILSATAVPIFHRANVYTAYEYLEKRFDAKTRALASVIFLIQRGLAVGLSLYAPAIVLAVIFGWPDRITTLVMGALITIYTVTGGIKAVTWTDVQQMIIILFGLVVAFIMIVHMLPRGVSFTDAVYLAGAAGKLNAVDLKFDLERPLQPVERADRRHVPGALLFRLRSIAGAALSDRANPSRKAS